MPVSHYLESSSARLSLTGRISRSNRLSGAWWPNCLDLDVELPRLLRSVAPILGVVQGVMLTRDEWPDTPVTWRPRTMPRLRISWYCEQDPNTVVLIGRNTDRLGLLVIPPSTEEPVASEAMRMASAAGNTSTGPAVLAAALSSAR